jgi:hypothetical protein
MAYLSRDEVNGQMMDNIPPRATACPQRALAELVDKIHPRVARVVHNGLTDNQAVTGVEIYGPDTGCPPGVIVLVPGTKTPEEEQCILTQLQGRQAAGVILEAHDHDAPDRDEEIMARTYGLTVWRRTPKVSWNATLDHFRSAFFSPDVGMEDLLPGIVLGDLQRVADGLADMLGGPVIIEDAQLEVITYSSYDGPVDRGRDAAIRGRRMPTEWRNHLQEIGAFDALLSSDTVIDVPDGPLGANRRLLTSVRLEGQLLGILWIAEGEAPLPDDIRMKLARAAKIVLPHLRQYNLDRLSQTRERNQKFRSLFEGVTLPIGFLVESGLAPAAGYSLIGVRHADGEPFRDRERERILDSISLYFLAFRWGAAPILIGGTAYCLLAISERTSIESLNSAIQRFLRTCTKTLDTPLHIAISDLEADMTAMPRMKAEVERLLSTLSRLAYRVSRTITATEGTVEFMLDQARTAAEQAGAGHYRKLATLEAYDARHNTELTNTLATYFAFIGNVSTTSDNLHLHKTTLRYRLKRISEISGISLDDPHEHLLCSLLLRDRAISPARPLADSSP